MNESELKELIKKYFNEIVNLKTKYNILIKLNEFYSQHKNFYSFYNIIVQSINDSLLTDIFVSLSKIYDVKFDKTDKPKINWNKDGRSSGFNVARFFNLLQNNLSETDIQEGRRLIDNKSDIIINLLTHRDKYQAHFDIEYFIDSTNLFEKYPIKYSELKELINLSDEILNRFSSKILEENFYCEHLNFDLIFQNFVQIWIDNIEKRK